MGIDCTGMGGSGNVKSHSRASLLLGTAASLGAAGSCNFPTDSCKLTTEEIMGAQNFNFAPKFCPNGDFQSQILHFRTNFSDKKIL